MRNDNENIEMTLSNKHLVDEILIAYAWKKTQTYITSTNWYADNFELKLSSLNLENTIINIKEKVEKVGSFDNLHLIPVPKSCKWHFQTDDNKKLNWKPIEISKQKLRPLAHISICDQTIMTMLMMGLANRAETIQGDPNTAFNEVHEKGVVSYGNRLYCQYLDDEALYNYSSSNTYSKYFTDYQKFLKRPQYFAKENIGKISPDEDLYILELDIEKFFDNVDREKLNDKIAKLNSNEKNEHLKNILKKFNNWDWDEYSLTNFPILFKDYNAPRGIPQGLVAAGFLSNIYLLDFDELLKNKINSNLDKTEIKLIDYCRYVDDIRLVIKCHKSIDKFDILKKIEELFNEYIQDLDLKFNTEKSKIEKFIGSSGNISNKLSILKSRLSGPIPFEDIEDQLGHLEALLNLTKEDKFQEEIGKESSPNFLQQIDKQYFDLREDTVKRFSANKICKILSEIRHFTSQEVDSNGVLIPGEWDYVQERIARRFIAIWCYDPSMTLLLKKGLELFPDLQLLRPIINELRALIKGNDKVLKSIAEYSLAEIFRHSSTVIHNKNKLAFPVHANIDSFFELLQSCAAEKIKSSQFFPNFDLLVKQAEYLLLVRLDSTLEISSNNKISDFVFKLCNGFRTISDESLTPQQAVLSILLANNINTDQFKFYRALSGYLEDICERQDYFDNLLDLVVDENPEIIKNIFFYSKSLSFNFARTDSFVSLVKRKNFDVVPLSGDIDSIQGSHSILKIMKRHDNPFANEIMALKLFRSLIENEKISKGVNKDLFFDFSKTQVDFNNYSNPPKFFILNNENDLELDIQFKKAKPGIIYNNIDMSRGTLHKIANFIRSVILGKEDWVVSSSFLTNKDSTHELRSSFASRNLGVWSSPEYLLGEGTQISNWLTNLLSKLLQLGYYQPSKNIYGWPEILTLNDLKKIIKERLDFLKKYYCQLSETPALIERVDLGWSKDKKNLSVAMIQSKMPHVKDIKDYGLYLNNSLYRPQHRRHLTRVCKLVLEHIKAQKVYEPLEEENPDHNHIDILVWPELAVHKDDLDVLINLSKKTKSIIYAGLCYIDQPGIDGPNNCAIWIVPNMYDSKQVEIRRLQGKKHMMALEKSIKSWRPYQLFLELIHPAFPNEQGFMITGSICYDATDICLSSDLRDKSNAYFVSALNKDINTFDSMVEALHYHMYQHVVLVNSGEFGGSYAKAPYKDHYSRLISHVHGNDQVSISTFQMNMFDFRRDNVGSGMKSGKELKSIPAGLIKN